MRAFGVGDLHGATTEGVFHLGLEHSPSHWEYRAVLVDRRASRHVVSSGSIRSWDDASAIAAQAAELLGVSHVPGAPERELGLSRVGDRVVLDHHELRMGRSIFLRAVVVLVGMALMALAGWLLLRVLE